MAVKAKPKREESFVNAAPDATERGSRKGKRRQITLTVPDELLAELDAAAARNGVSRAAALNQAARRWVEQEG